MTDAILRLASGDDAETVHRFIRALAAYERDPDAVKATPESLREQLAAERPPFECLLAEVSGEPRGFALFFHNYSTWRGRQGLYLEDLFVIESWRGKGLGRRLLAELARLAIDRGCARLDWVVLEWNQPAIEFYQSLRAEVLRGWLPCRLQGDALRALADAGAAGAVSSADSPSGD